MHKIINKLLIILILIISSFISGCSTTKSLSSNKFDPIETFNRNVFFFNKIADDIIFKPSIKIYNKSTPMLVKNIINNFCLNIAILPTITNNILQGNITEAKDNSLTFLINSSIGHLGMFNFANRFNIISGKELSFSNTLVFYEYNTPFYFVLPILGPSTMTNLITFIPDYFFNPQSILSKKYKKFLFWSVLFNKKVQLLEKEVLINMSSSSMDEYAFVRNAYLQYNKFNIYY